MGHPGAPNEPNKLGFFWKANDIYRTVEKHPVFIFLGARM